MRKKTRLSSKMLFWGSVKRRRLASEPSTWGFSVRRIDGKDFTDRQVSMIVGGNESVIEYDVIDLYFGSKAEADNERELLRKKGFKVDKATEVLY